MAVLVAVVTVDAGKTLAKRWQRNSENVRVGRV